MGRVKWAAVFCIIFRGQESCCLLFPLILSSTLRKILEIIHDKGVSKSHVRIFNFNKFTHLWDKNYFTVGKVILICADHLFVDAENLFEHELGALNMAALLRKEERAGLLSNLGPCCKALCFRRDSAIRKQLVKNEKASAWFT